MKNRNTYYIYMIFLLIFSPTLFSQNELSPEKIYEKVNDAVVLILSYDFDGNLKNQGSGVVLSEEGFVVTNYHVFSESERLEIRHNNKEISLVEIIGADIERDVLVLKISDKSFSAIEIANLNELKIGQRIYAIGSPMGYENTISEGIISGFRKFKDGQNLIQITASLSSGSSGGAVVNSKGELIGISTASVKEGQNLNFAIPISEVLGLETKSDRNEILTMNLFYKGYNATISEKYEEALEYYNSLLNISPNNANVHYNIGVVYLRRNEYDKAAVFFKKAIEIEPDRKEFIEQYDYVKKQIAQPKVDYKEDKTDKKTRVFEEKKDSKIERQKYNTKAVEYLNTAKELIAKSKDEEDVSKKLTILKQAAAYLEKVIKTDSNIAEAYYLLGQLYDSPANLNDVKKTKKYYDKVEYLINNSGANISASVSNREMLVEIAGFYQLQEKDIEVNSLKAIRLFEKALEEPLPVAISSYSKIEEEHIYFEIYSTNRQLANFLVINISNKTYDKNLKMLKILDAGEYYDKAMEYYNRFAQNSSIGNKNDRLFKIGRREILRDKKILDLISDGEWNVFVNTDYKTVIHRLGKPLISSNDYVFIYHDRFIEKSKIGIVKVWIKKINLRDPEERENDDYEYSKSLYEFDLKNNKFRILQQSIYYNSDYITDENYPKADWQFVSPESITEEIVKNLKVITK